MYHCITFKADEIYYLSETDIYTNRVLSIGFCPLCNKPVAELIEQSFTGGINKTTVSGINANNMVNGLKDSILYSAQKDGYRKLRAKPYGWKFGVNKEYKNGKIRQYACDFYGNKELIKKM